MTEPTVTLCRLAQQGFKPSKYFSIDRVFRNEAIDRTHLAEFHQIEGLGLLTSGLESEASCCSHSTKSCHVQMHHTKHQEMAHAVDALTLDMRCAGVVCDKGLTLGDLIGILHLFFQRLGMKKLRFKPAFNPYTEPSMEIFSYSEQLGKWVEVRARLFWLPLD